jgi:hypothetical protein
MIKYYFSTFPSEKHFEKQLLSQYQTCSKRTFLTTKPTHQGHN